jgi:DNA-binding transcriptional LysR family regulator
MLVVAPVTLERPLWRSDGKTTTQAVVLSAMPTNTVWRVRQEDVVRELTPMPILRLSSLLLVRDAVLAGAGAALLPRSLIGMALERKRLALWGTAEGRAVSIWALHTSRRLTSLKVRAFIETLANAFPTRALTSD